MAYPPLRISWHFTPWLMSASGPPPSWAARSTVWNQIVLHLGNGASAFGDCPRPAGNVDGPDTAWRGLVGWAPRSGDLDPGVISYLWRTARMGVEDIESMSNYIGPGCWVGGEGIFAVYD